VASGGAAGRFGVLAAAGMGGWLGGLALQMQQSALVPGPIDLALAVAGGIALALGVITGGGATDPGDRRAWRGALVPALVIAAAAAALAFGTTGLRAGERLEARLAPDLEGRDLRIVGVVASLPQRSASGLRFEFEVESALLGDEPVAVPRRVLLGWYAAFHEDATLSTPQRALRAGQRWTLQVRLRRPHGAMNPGGFDLERHLFERGLGATGYVRAAPPQVVEPADDLAVLRARQAMRDAIERRLGDTREAGVIAALALGDQSAIARDDWDLFRLTGVAHLMSISGLHVTMFAWLAGAVAGFAWRRSARLCLQWPAPRAAALLGLASAAAYAVFAGWGVPAQRTVWMLATVTLLAASGRRWPWPLVLGAAAAVVTAVDPWAVLDAGFWLSFGAVGLLMASNPWSGSTASAHWASAAAGAQAGIPAPAPSWRARARDAVAAAWRTQLIATVGLAPLTLLLFQQVSAVGLLANLVAVPWVTLVVTPLALLGALLPALWSAAATAVAALTALLEAAAALPGAVFEVPLAPVWIQLAALLGGLVAVLPLPWRWRALALPLIAPMLLPPVDRPAAGEFEVLALDVGQGTAVLVRTRRHLLVYDAGPRFSRDSDAGERLVLPALRARGEWRIDRLVLSHRDLDHVGGAAALLRERPVGELLSSLEPGHPLLGLAARQGVRAQACGAGQSWSWDGVRFEVLHPPAAAETAAARPNTVSCVLRVAREGDAPGASGASVLLTGDIEREQELALVERAGPSLASRVLLVPHHGSRTSSSAPFLDAVAPGVAVVQAGYRSRFGHPAPVVVERLAQRGITIVASPACGAWRWQSDRPGAVCERDAARRYWHHAGDDLPRPR
jgi:competence protein ComEC